MCIIGGHHRTLTGKIKKTCLSKFREEQLAPISPIRDQYLFNWIAESKSGLFLFLFIR